MNKLKPCPFCGGKSELHDHRLSWFVRCVDCCARVDGEIVPEFHGTDEESTAQCEAVDWDAIKQSSIDKWNTRATPSVEEAAKVRSDANLIDMIQSEFLEVTSFAIPTGQGDADIGWEVANFHMSEPKRRVIGTSYDEGNLRAALNEAWKHLAGEGQ